MHTREDNDKHGGNQRRLFEADRIEAEGCNSEPCTFMNSLQLSACLMFIHSMFPFNDPKCSWPAIMYT